MIEKRLQNILKDIEDIDEQCPECNSIALEAVNFDGLSVLAPNWRKCKDCEKLFMIRNKPQKQKFNATR
jgi:hypothetical protein